jgi:hypothetical protein
VARHPFLPALWFAVSLSLVACSKQNPGPATGGSGGETTLPRTGGGLGTGGGPGTGGSLGTGGSFGSGGMASGGTATMSSGGNGGRRGSNSASGGASESTGGRNMGGSSTTGGADAASAGASGSGGASGGRMAGEGGSAGATADGSVANADLGGATPTFTFFVSSDKSKTGNLGGLKAADQRCQALAAAVGQGQQTWRAYLSADSDPDSGDAPVDARDRIGKGPFYNSKGVLLAQDLAALHLLKGDAEVFLDEQGNKVPGNWSGSPTPIEHDILTGSKSDGTLAPGKTCDSWTSADSTKAAVVGHSDGLGPGGATTGTYTSWNASHDNGNCADTAPKGGAGRIYCFAVH